MAIIYLEHCPCPGFFFYRMPPRRRRLARQSFLVTAAAFLVILRGSRLAGLIGSIGWDSSPRSGDASDLRRLGVPVQDDPLGIIREGNTREIFEPYKGTLRIGICLNQSTGVRRNKSGKSYAVESTLLVRTTIFDSKILVEYTNHVVRVDSVKQGAALPFLTRKFFKNYFGLEGSKHFLQKKSSGARSEDLGPSLTIQEFTKNRYSWFYMQRIL